MERKVINWSHYFRVKRNLVNPPTKTLKIQFLPFSIRNNLSNGFQKRFQNFLR